METSVNNKCKAFTSLEQSKKLAEILPLESADMRYVSFGDTHPWIWNEEVKLLEKGSVPCWSLAALLSVLPQPHLERYDENTWICSVFNKDNHFIDNASKNDPVDACYEMILKLHELKLL